MGAICLTESDERVRPRAALKSASDERPKPPNTSLHFRMQCRKKVHCTMQFMKCIGIQVSRHLWAEVGFSAQYESGSG